MPAYNRTGGYGRISCKHIVVPSVASGKSVKLKSPFVRCSVVESLFCEFVPCVYNNSVFRIHSLYYDVYTALRSAYTYIALCNNCTNTRHFKTQDCGTEDDVNGNELYLPYSYGR